MRRLNKLRAVMVSAVIASTLTLGYAIVYAYQKPVISTAVSTTVLPRSESSKLALTPTTNTADGPASPAVTKPASSVPIAGLPQNYSPSSCNKDDMISQYKHLRDQQLNSENAAHSFWAATVDTDATDYDALKHQEDQRHDNGIKQIESNYTNNINSIKCEQ